MLTTLHAQDLRGRAVLSRSWPAAIELFEHSMSDVARLPLRGAVVASRFVTDLTVGLSEVFDYLKDS